MMHITDEKECEIKIMNPLESCATIEIINLSYFPFLTILNLVPTFRQLVKDKYGIKTMH